MFYLEKLYKTQKYRPQAKNTHIPDGKLNEPLPGLEELESKIKSWFVEYLNFPRVLPVGTKVVHDGRNYKCHKRAISFGIDNGKELILSPLEASFLQLSANMIIENEVGGVFSCDQILARALDHSNISAFLAVFNLFR